MDWIRKNKFLAGYLAFIIVGAGGLIYLLLGSMGTYDQVSQDYQTAVTELHRLQALEPYPEQANLQKLDELRKSYAASVTQLQAKLAAYEPPLDPAPVSPVQFQDKLRRVVDEVTQRAQAVKMGLPEGFYMGFETYRGTPPETGAAQALSVQLDAIVDLVNILIDKRVEKLSSIKRAPLPQEPGGANGAAAATAPATAAKPGAKPSVELVQKFPVEIAFTAQRSNFRETLNALATAKRLYVVRALQVKNEVDKGPPRELAGGPGQPPAPGAQPPAGVPADPNNPNAAPEKPPLRYIVGLEKLEADVRIDLVRVAPPASAAR